MNKYLSNKLSFFSFWLIVLVVLLHSINVDIATCNNLMCSVQHLLSYKLSQIAVPLFFIVSGYLYFFKLKFNKNVDFYFFIANIRKRFKTLLIPYLIWCTIWFLFMYVIQYLPIAESYFSQPLHEMSTKNKLLNLFYYPINYPFWFLRELMILVILSPCIFVFIKYFRILFMILIVVITLIFENLIVLKGINLLSTASFFFFSLGAILAITKSQIIFNAKRVWTFILVAVWLFLNFISLINEKNHFLAEYIIQGFDVFKDFFGCVAVWYLYDFLNRKKQWENYEFYNFSFFIFAFHGVPTLILVKLSKTLFGNDSLLLFISYLIIVPLIIIFSIFIGNLFKKNPDVYDILVGKRGG